ncbi:hypothetical protein [Pseudorhodoplanes sp.]|uniref:head-tail connector protein n=1 Tax=Pseudorhodoplanes sp. TaxID=1934341 RepID=UPI0039195F98
MGLVAMEAPPAAVALDEVNAFLRVATSEEDALIAGFVRSASAACEAFTGLPLMTREVREIVVPGSWRRLEARPVQAIEAVAAVANDGAETLLAADTYRIDIDAAGDGWVRVPSSERRASVRYTAGLAGDWNGLPEPLRQGIVRLAAHLYAERSGTASPPPACVTALWRPWRRMRLG